MMVAVLFSGAAVVDSAIVVVAAVIAEIGVDVWETVWETETVAGFVGLDSSVACCSRNTNC